MLLVGSVVVLVLALSVIPMHVTLGGGSHRCGTVFSPDARSEIGDVCPEARSSHAAAALAAAGVLAVVASLPLAAERLLREEAPRLLSTVWAAVWLVSAGVALIWIGWFVEYSPPHEVFEL